jgi:hypothetical protein
MVVSFFLRDCIFLGFAFRISYFFTKCQWCFGSDLSYNLGDQKSVIVNINQAVLIDDALIDLDGVDAGWEQNIA